METEDTQRETDANGGRPFVPFGRTQRESADGRGQPLETQREHGHSVGHQTHCALRV